jgi:hypothetical protein
MTARYAAAREWVLIRSSISAVAFDVENREKGGDDNKKHRINHVSPGTDPFSKAK